MTQANPDSSEQNPHSPADDPVDRYAVIGNPIEHSLSPEIHRQFAAATGEVLTYSKILGSSFVEDVDGFFAAGGAGLNVTLPFKLDAFAWGEKRAAAAVQAGAANTLYLDEGIRCCTNTDGAGLLRDMTVNLGWTLRDRRILLVGAGGAVRGVLGPLLAAKPAELVVANRTRARAEELAEIFDIHAAGLDEPGDGWDIVINGTSAGVDGVEGSLLPAPVVRDARCYDMFYRRDGQTPFAAWAAAHGAHSTADGLGMLVEQAAESFSIWRGVRPPTADVLKALRST